MTDHVGKCWNEGSRAVLKQLWARGMPARRIAAIITALTCRPCTRNSVIGKANRLGLPPHTKAPKHAISDRMERCA